MQLARYRVGTDTLIGVVNGGTITSVDLERLGATDVARRIGVAALAAGGWRDEQSLPLGDPLRLDDVQLLAPVPAPQKIIGVGLNYGLHAAESGIAPPAYPEIFAKFADAIANPGAPIKLSDTDSAMDFEGELAVVIGSTAHRLSHIEALDAIAGYTIANDVSARTIQLRVSQWVAGKAGDSYCPLGPWLATPESIPDPQNLGLRTKVNGEILQEASTSEMIFGVADLVVYLSSLMTLVPGDLILTGTPAGVGHARSPQQYLKSGDVVEIQIDGIGTLQNQFVHPAPMPTVR